MGLVVRSLVAAGMVGSAAVVVTGIVRSVVVTWAGVSGLGWGL